MSTSRVLVWYSDGAASAVAAKLAVQKYGDRCEVVKCDTTEDEHADNYRFRQDVERWIGRPVTLLRSEDFRNVDEVIEKRRYMAGVHGAPCTTALKKQVREAYQRPNDIHVFGYTAEPKERKRAREFGEHFPELTCDWVLIDRGISKQDCYTIIADAGISLPTMYRLGYDHNNCLGCVKATSPGYWNRIRRDFPAVFAKRARQSRELGVKLARLGAETEEQRILLDDLPPDYGLDTPDGDIECGPFCEMGESLVVQSSIFATLPASTGATDE